jgi:prepilin-type N-terminal cleavage/methylation domain-containing protein
VRGTCAYSTLDEKGVSLIEIIIALSILATVLIALGGLMFQAARHTRQSAAVAYRSAASTSAAAWIQGLPWDSLGGAVGCTADSTGPFSYDRCVTVQTVSAKLKRVTVAIVATGVLIVAPDTLVISRSRPRPRSPLRAN